MIAHREADLYEIASPPDINTDKKLAEQRVVFHNLTWDSYQQILKALGNHRSSRLTYDQGTLEIVMPLEEHERATRLIELFIRILVGETGLKLKTMGSTTLERPDLERSAEPDNAFYIQNQSKVTGKKVDITQDPPPDLVIEIDITHTDINKFRFYSSLGVPEFWRYNGKVLKIYQLQGESYQEIENSPTFPFPIKEHFYEFLQDCYLDEIGAEKVFRAWVRENFKNE